MNQEIPKEMLRQLSGPQLQHRLLAELEELLGEIEDGTVRSDSFTGCIAIGNQILPPLNEKQSTQIKNVLSRTPTAITEAEKGGHSILSTVFHLIRNLWGPHSTGSGPARLSNDSLPSLLDEHGRIKRKDTGTTEDAGDGPLENHEIQLTELNSLFTAHGEKYTWALPYSWDIANKLNAVSHSDTEGDLALFLERRKKLNIRRPKATRFEQSAQRYAAKISELFTDENGNIISQESLETLIRELVSILLDKTRPYWPTRPLLAIFDGVVATIFRPLLHKHRTVHYQSRLVNATGVIQSGNTKMKTAELVTTPTWNEESQKRVQHYVKKAFKAQVWSLFIDRYAPYNREYARTQHLDATTLTHVGLAVKNFGNPVHLNQIMDLLQPTNQADELVQYVNNHFRSDERIDH
ncbi:MAG: hypothetical protein GY703_11820 [Gammaproteobacteria bacterium]|nr:hypothetical protein [Gammaproteobacteria bacterium]